MNATGARCPSEAQVAAFVERTLPAAERDTVEAHVYECETCREALAHVVATTGAPRQLGRYRLDRVIGSGGMGVVWQAWDPALERRLAIKLLRPEVTDDDGGARLVREARALARLQHPNVVAVHDVGEVEGEVFIATELIDGESMARWQQGRPAPEVIAAYAQAARGLAAANQLGLVHRDVKPSNILVGRDGRVRIGDFGLATRDRTQAAPAGSDDIRPSSQVSGTEATLTAGGRIVGTPAYMPPEQRAGAAVDERADQYSLCVAIAEALTGARPAAGTTAAALAAHGVAAPWDVIARGLAVAPGDRHADLAPLVAALEGAPRRGRRWVIAPLAAGAAAIALVVLRGAAPADHCAGRQPLAASWGADAQRQLVALFHASGLAYADDAAATVTTALDGFTTAFTAADRQVCEAPARPRAACLDRVRGQLDALLGTMQTTPDAATIQRAAASVRALPDPALCTTPGELAEQTIPADVTLALRMRWMSAEVARAAALRRLGKLPAARELAERVVADARAAQLLPAVAEAQHELGTILHAQSDPAAEQTLVDAMTSAAAAHEDQRGARISALLVEVVGDHGDVAAAERQARLARPAIVRAGSDRRLDAVVERGLGHASQAARKYADAYDHLKRADGLDVSLGASDDLDLDRRAEVVALGSLDRIDEATRLNDQVLASDRVHLGPKHPKTIADLTAGGMLLFRGGRYAQAATQLEAALALEEEVSGKTSDGVASLSGALGGAYMALGRMAEAEVRFRATVDVLASHRPASDFQVRGQRMNLAAVLILLGRYRDAERQLEALIAAARAASDDESLGLVLQNYAEALTRDGQHARALDAGREALTHDAKAFGATSRRGAEAYATLGTVYTALGQLDQAADAYGLSIEMFERVVGKDTAELADPLTGLGELRLTRGDAAGARAALEHAVKLAAGGDPVDLARSRFGLARALAALHEAAAARTEASAAETLLRGAGERAAARRAQVEAWLAAHP